MPTAPRFPDSQQAAHWGIAALGVDKLVELTGKGILVGHLDSGVDGRHPALHGAKIAHFAVIDAQGRAKERDPFDAGWHGTHTAATIAGWNVPGQPRVGVAPGAKLASAIVFDRHSDRRRSSARLLGGIQWAMEKGVRILNMSVGVEEAAGDAAEFRDILKLLRARNILPVCATGNDGPATCLSPAHHAEALSVGAALEDRDVWPASGSAKFQRALRPNAPSLIAPGSGILSAFPATMRGGQWLHTSGTSMAAAHISGLAALLMQVPGAPSAQQVEDAILDSCILTGDPERVGRGFPDAVRAVALLKERVF